jgi:streptogrisin C
MGKPKSEIYGGLPLSKCTSGFSVRQTQDPYLRGITTAGHCDNNLSYNGINLIFMTQLYAGSYDIQWHRAPGFTVTNKIKDGNHTTRFITSTKHRNNQVIGECVCKYGKTTGYTCGHINSKTLCPSRPPSCQPTYIRVSATAGFSPLLGGGDSGGPWFLGNTAYGTSVSIPGDNHNDAIYMAVNYVAGMSVSVMTQP